MIKWGRGEGETLSIHVMWTRCALGLMVTNMYLCIHHMSLMSKWFLIIVYSDFWTQTKKYKLIQQENNDREKTQSRKGFPRILTLCYMSSFFVGF